jgi:hypothetical protein
VEHGELPREVLVRQFVKAVELKRWKMSKHFYHRSVEERCDPIPFETLKAFYALSKTNDKQFSTVVKQHIGPCRSVDVDPYEWKGASCTVSSKSVDESTQIEPSNTLSYEQFSDVLHKYIKKRDYESSVILFEAFCRTFIPTNTLLHLLCSSFPEHEATRQWVRILSESGNDPSAISSHIRDSSECKRPLK